MGRYIKKLEELSRPIMVCDKGAEPLLTNKNMFGDQHINCLAKGSNGDTKPLT